MKATIFLGVRQEGKICGYEIKPLNFSTEDLSNEEFELLKDHLDCNEVTIEELQNKLPLTMNIKSLKLIIEDNKAYYQIDFETSNNSYDNELLKVEFINTFKNIDVCSDFGMRFFNESDDNGMELIVEIDEYNSMVNN